jgi:hypothetical protein
MIDDISIQKRIDQLTLCMTNILTGSKHSLTSTDVANVAAVISELDRVRGENELWQQKASRLYDLLHECAQWIPRGQVDLYDRVTHELDSGLRYLDDVPIGEDDL